MNTAKFNEMLHVWTPAEMRKTYMDLLEEMKITLAQISLHGASIGCIMYHLTSDETKQQAMQIIGALREYCNEFATVQSQMKSIRYQLQSMGAELRG